MWVLQRQAGRGRGPSGRSPGCKCHHSTHRPGATAACTTRLLPPSTQSLDHRTIVLSEVKAGMPYVHARPASRSQGERRRHTAGAALHVQRAAAGRHPSAQRLRRKRRKRAWHAGGMQGGARSRKRLAHLIRTEQPASRTSSAAICAAWLPVIQRPLSKSTRYFSISRAATGKATLGSREGRGSKQRRGRACTQRPAPARRQQRCRAQADSCCLAICSTHLSVGLTGQSAAAASSQAPRTAAGELGRDTLLSSDGGGGGSETAAVAAGLPPPASPPPLAIGCGRRSPGVRRCVEGVFSGHNSGHKASTAGKGTHCRMHALH